MEKTSSQVKSLRSRSQPKKNPDPADANFILPDFFADSNLDILSPVAAHKLSSDFINPISEYLNRPRKNFRSSLVEAGSELVSSNTQIDPADMALVKDAIECLHAGSLIIDDIQDGSTRRRGSQAMHVQQGMPAALCLGNWMYFWPLRLLERVSWTDHQKILAYEYFHKTLEFAHYGQFLDLTTKTDVNEDNRLAELSIKTAELKTGTITSLAFVLGALLTGANANQLKIISTFGKKFGLILQRLDDWGNLCSRRAGEKRFEDLAGEKPTTIWHDLVNFGGIDEITAFKRAVSFLPNQGPIEHWLEHSPVPEKSLINIETSLNASIEDLNSALDTSRHLSGISKLKKIAEALLHAYD